MTYPFYNGGYTDRKDVMNIYAIFYEGESYNEAGEVTEVILDGNLPNQNYDCLLYTSRCV